MPAGLSAAAAPLLGCRGTAGGAVPGTGPRSRSGWKGEAGHPTGWLRSGGQHPARLLPPLEPAFRNNSIQRRKIWIKAKRKSHGSLSSRSAEVEERHGGCSAAPDLLLCEHRAHHLPFARAQLNLGCCSPSPAELGVLQPKPSLEARPQAKSSRDGRGRASGGGRAALLPHLAQTPQELLCQGVLLPCSLWVRAALSDHLPSVPSFF